MGVTINGLDSLLNDLAELADLPDEVADGILEAEAEVIAAAQREEIGRRWSGPYSEHISADSIAATDTRKGGGVRSISIYPHGTRARGGERVRNAEIAFINEYGAPGRHVAPRPAIAAANKKKEKEAVEAGEKVYHAYLDSKKL